MIIISNRLNWILNWVAIKMLSADKSKNKTVTATNTVSLPALITAPSLQQYQPYEMYVLISRHIGDTVATVTQICNPMSISTSVTNKVQWHPNPNDTQLATWVWRSCRLKKRCWCFSDHQAFGRCQYLHRIVWNSRKFQLNISVIKFF